MVRPILPARIAEASGMYSRTRKFGYLLALVATLGCMRSVAWACPAPAAPPTYNCGGGLCSPSCPSGSAASLRNCSHQVYDDSRVRPVFGPIAFKYATWNTPTIELRWATASSGDYNSFIQKTANGADCKDTERNLGNKFCPTCGGPMQGDPINVATGNVYEDEVDYEGPGSFPLRFHRYYNSYSAGIGKIGLRWSHSGWRELWLQSSTEVKISRDDGEVRYFNQCGSAWCATADETGTLTQLFDADGHTTGWKYVDENDVTERYEGSGQLLSETSRGGIVHTMAYNGSGQLLTIKDSFGHQLSMSYGTDGQLQHLTLPSGDIVNYTYDALKRLTSVTYPGSATRTYLYDEAAHIALGTAPNVLTGIEDENGQRFATFDYDAQVRAIDSEHASGADRIEVTYNLDGTSTVLDAAGTSRTFAFQTVESVYHIAFTSGLQCAGCGFFAAYGYNAGGDVTSKTDFNGHQTAFSLNARHLEDSRTEAYGSPNARTISTTWDSNFRRPATITEPNRTTSFNYDASGNLLTRTVTDTSVSPNVSRTWTYTYDSFGRVLTEDGPRTDVLDVTTYAYYSCTTGSQCGHVQTTTNALGQVTTFNSYNAHGQPTQITDPNGLVVTMAYDGRMRVTDRCVGAAIPACTGGELTHLDYWPTGLLKKVTNPDASYVQYTYDNAHRLTQINDGVGNKIVYTLDAKGNRIVEETDDPASSLKRTHSRVFNSLNQLWKDVNAAGTAAVTTTFGYDFEGNQTSVAAPLSRNSGSAYDELNRLTQITDPNSGITQFGYDANDNLTSVTDPRSLATSYTYTGFGDLKTQTSPDTGVTANTYDSGGNLSTSTDARGAVTTYTYDALNRVTGAAYTIGATTDQTITYTYDSGTNGKGHLTGASDANHSLSWAYDTRGRVTSKGQTVGAVAQLMSYGYNGNGQLTSTTLPSGAVIQYGYNSNNQVNSVTLLGSPNVTILSGITYDPFGPITGWTWGSGPTMTRVFDTDGKLTNINSSASAVGNRTLGYDDAFRITSISDSASGGPSWTYGYDILDRLNSATMSGTTIGYTHDANGNRLTQTGTSASTYTVSGTSNKLTSVSGALARSYTYDNSGNTLTTGATTHTYYNDGRMKTGALGAASATTYIYNALGQRVKKTSSTGTSLFVYDEAGHLVGEYTSTGSLVQETVWLGDIPVATIRSNGSGGFFVYYVHTDQLNTPRKVTNNDSALTMQWVWDPSPFGDGSTSAPTNPNGAFEYNLRFPGQLFDAETNLSYNYFRDYDPATGRYDESDPIGLRSGVNTYAYVLDDPLGKMDPTGLVPGTGTRPGTAPPKECCNTKTTYFDCLANCIEKYRFSWEAITTINLGNTAANTVAGRTPRGGIGTPAHSTSWQHRVGSAAARATGDVRYSYAGRALGRAMILPTIAEGFYDIGTELRCAVICEDCENRDNP